MAPSQVPPQAEPSLAQAGFPLRGAPETGAHVPTEPGTSHASHCPLHARSQQTPSVQAPLPHWPAAVQATPGAFFGTQAPASQ